ncbi:hypothetical protein QR680_018963 [Steinernema hermaphroditum]|uniref:Uncharacterized protein n=1 Tax=Steinernema hermaphroditum TaxID=289476 RepID=A0AA39HJJ1_9BILA|nr:hypothetical protein QR680_018963 [Steinernema hermaphroditum]
MRTIARIETGRGARPQLVLQQTKQRESPGEEEEDREKVYRIPEIQGVANNARDSTKHFNNSTTIRQHFTTAIEFPYSANDDLS